MIAYILKFEVSDFQGGGGAIIAPTPETLVTVSLHTSHHSMHVNLSNPLTEAAMYHGPYEGYSDLWHRELGYTLVHLD